VAATVPAWGILFYLASEFEKRIEYGDTRLRHLHILIGGGWAIVLTTLAGLALLLVDHISWRPSTNDRTNKLIECPRDAWQGLPDIIPTEYKADYLKELIAAGSSTLMR